MQSLNALISQSPSLFHITTSLADRPVFLLPVFLLRMYVWRGMIRKHLSAKYGALLILAVAVLTIAINLGIQHFIDKARPETALLALGHLVMQHLPTRSFPSDHAAVSFAIAMGALMRGAL